MDFESLTALLNRSPAVKLLRAHHAPLILGFLYRTFKETHQLTLSHYELVNKLADYLEATQGIVEGDFGDMLLRAKRHIDEWCNEENRYLRKFSDERGEPVHELTADTEKVFQWIESLKKKEFVGTESRFIDIFTKIRELIEQSAEDPRQRIAELERKREEIEAKIREIQLSGKVEIFSDTQIKERFFDICRRGRELIADFKEVEENFKAITRNIYEKQSGRHMTKGAILSYTLDATDELRDSDQGRSFHAFWRFLMADNRQDELNRLTGQVFSLLEVRGIESDDPFLRRMKSNLHEAGQKVVLSNHRLAEKLSRILAETFLAERRKAAELTGDIKNLALAVLDNPPGQADFIEIEGDADIKMGMDRPLGEPSQTADFANQPAYLGGGDVGSVDLEKLFEQFEIDREILMHRIDEMIRDQGQVTLADVLRVYPLTHGLSELVAYLAIATASGHHLIDDRHEVVIDWLEKGSQKQIRMPQVIYGKDLTR